MFFSNKCVSLVLIMAISSIQPHLTYSAFPTTGLKRLYRGDGSGVDATGSGNDLFSTVKGGAAGGVITYATVELPGRSSSRQAFHFNTEYATKGPATGLPAADEPRTIIGWFMPESRNHGGIFGYGMGKSTCNTEYYILIMHQTVLLDQWCDYAGVGNIIGGELKVGEWYHIAAAYDGSQNIVYVNGELVRRGTPVTPNTIVDDENSHVFIGSNNPMNNQASIFDGKIADVAIYDRALTLEEVESIFNDGDDDSVALSMSPSVALSMSPSMTSADQFEWEIDMLDNGTMVGQSSFVMSYNISNRDYEFGVFQDDCETRVEGALEEVETVTGFGDGFKNVTASLAIVLRDIEKNVIWTGNKYNGGQINFCVVMSLMTKSKNDENVMVMFLNTEYKIDVDITSGFTVTNIVAERKANQDGGRGTIDYKEEITAFQCNDDYSILSPVPTLVQGDILQVCMQVSNTESMFEASYVRDMKVSQVENVDSPVMVVSNRTDFAYDQLTLTECNGDENQICRVKFQLIGSFFEKDEPPKLNVDGVVTLKLKAGRRRRLDEITVNAPLRHDINISEKRKLLEVANEDSSSFELEVEISKKDESKSMKKRVHVILYAVMVIVGGAYAF